MMFVLKSRAEATFAHLRHMLREANEVADGHFRAWDQAEQRLRHARARVREVEAKLADLQKPKQDAGAQAFASIVQHLDFARLEQRVLAHYAHQVAAHRIAAKTGARPALYEGHAAEGGLQRHSIGEEYPFVVYGQQARDGVQYRVLDTRNGRTYFNAFDSSRAASAFVRRCKSDDRTFTDNGFLIPRSK